MSTAKTDDVAALVEQLRKDIATLTQTVTQMAADGVRSSTEHLRNTAGSAARKASEAGQDALKDATKLVEDATHDLEAQVRRKPLTAMMAALGIGFVLGLVTRR